MPCVLSSHLQSDRPSAWVERFAPLIAAGEVLDLACGGGRHARLLVGLGHSVLAVDRDPVALDATAGPGITVRQVDLERSDMVWPFEPGRFAGIVVTNYLHRPLFPHLFRSLAVDGILIYETFGRGNEHFGKPSSPDFLLASGELLEVVAEARMPDLRVVAFEDGYTDTPKPAMVQRVCLWKAAPGSAPDRLKL